MVKFQEIRSVQARDLPAFEQAHRAAGHAHITVRLNNVWREVFDVWTDDDDPAETLGPDTTFTAEIKKWTDWDSPCWVVVRYVDEAKSSDGTIEDGLFRIRTCDLVDVQVPVLAEIPAAPAQPPAVAGRFGHVNYHCPYVSVDDDPVAGRWTFRLAPEVTDFAQAWAAAVAEFKASAEVADAAREAGHPFNYGDLIDHHHGRDVLARHGLHFVHDRCDASVLVDHDEHLVTPG